MENVAIVDAETYTEISWRLLCGIQERTGIQYRLEAAQNEIVSSQDLQAVYRKHIHHVPRGDRGMRMPPAKATPPDIRRITNSSHVSAFISRFKQCYGHAEGQANVVASSPKK